jgi:hypothetical protein
MKTLSLNINLFFSISTFFSKYNSKSPLNFLDTTFFIVEDTHYKNTLIKKNLIESSLNTRYNRFFNLLVNYDYKTGHYMGNWEQQYPYLYTSFIEVARGIRKPS